MMLMDAAAVLYYGHCTLLDAVHDLPERVWNRPGACGTWSARDIVAHLGSYELVLCDVLTSVCGQNEPTPHLDEFISSGAQFNDTQVGLRRDWSVETTLGEYNAAHDRATELAKAVPTSIWTKTGTIPWYGAEYSLDDLIVYMYYGHKREHSAQIVAYCDQLSRSAASP
jgi:uncharacterized damage-inducible protein DinB